MDVPLTLCKNLSKKIRLTTKLILLAGTFTVAFYLKIFRNSHFLGRNARRALGDFGVPIAIALFVLVDYMIPEVYTEKLSVPFGISPSDENSRGWLIALGPVPTWLPFAAVVPSILVYILVFMETHISELIVVCIATMNRYFQFFNVSF